MNNKAKIIMSISLTVLVLMIGKAFILDASVKMYLVIFFFVGLGLAMSSNYLIPCITTPVASVFFTTVVYGVIFQRKCVPYLDKKQIRSHIKNGYILAINPPKCTRFILFILVTEFCYEIGYFFTFFCFW